MILSVIDLVRLILSPLLGTFSQMIAQSFSDFSISELMRLLCFESEEQAVDFLMVYSLKVSRDGQVIIEPFGFMCVFEVSNDIKSSPCV